MRRFFPLMAVAVAAIPLFAAVPATRIKEPNAVFAFDVDARTNRLVAVLFDRAKKKALENLDVTLEYPPYGIGGINDAVQFSTATKKVYVGSVEATDDTKHLGYDATYDTRIIESDFAWREQKEVFSCHACHVTGWIAHPSKPALYVAVKDDFTIDEFRNAKLLEIVLAPTLRTRVIGRLPARGDGIAITPDGSHVYAFALAENSDFPYGELVSIRLSDKRRVKTVVNLPREDAFGDGVHANTSNVSPDMRELVFPNAVLDIRTSEIRDELETGPYVGTNGVLAWSRDAAKLLFPVMQAPDAHGDRVDAEIVVDRTAKKTWTLPLLDVAAVDWSPAQTAILFRKGVDIGFYDLAKREWVDVLPGLGVDYSAEGAWATLPTKRVPRR